MMTTALTTGSAGLVGADANPASKDDAPRRPTSDIGPSSCGAHGIRWMDVVLPILLCASLVALCVLQSPLRRFWIDEILTYYPVADPSFSHMMGAMTDIINAGPPLYFITAWGWVRIFGDSELALRLFSCLGYCIGGVSLWWVLRRTFGRLPAAVSVFVVMLTSDELIHLNCEARWYGLFFAETMLATCLFVALCERPKAGIGLLIANAIVHAALVTTHYLTFFYSAASLLAFCVASRRDLRQLCLRCGSVLVGWLAFLPCIPGFLHHQQLGKPHGWISVPRAATLFDIYNTAGPNIAIVVLLFVVIFVLFDLFRHEASTQCLQQSENARDSSKSSPLLILALCLLLVPAVLWGYSVTWTPVFLSRYVLPSLVVSWGVLVAFSVRRVCDIQRRRSGCTSLAGRIIFAKCPQFVFAAMIMIALFAAFSRQDCLSSLFGGAVIGPRDDEETLQAMQLLPDDVPLLFADIHQSLVFTRYTDRPRNIILLIDQDWAYSRAYNVPRRAANDCQLALALRNQYAVRACEAKDVLKTTPRAVVVFPEKHRSLFDKWMKDGAFSSRLLFESHGVSAVLIQRKPCL